MSRDNPLVGDSTVCVIYAILLFDVLVQIFHFVYLTNTYGLLEYIATRPCTTKEFAESSFMVKRKDFNPTSPRRAESGEPGTHIVSAVFGCMISEIDK